MKIYSRFTFIIYLILTIFGINILSADENTWSTNGPSGGSVQTIEIHPVNRDIIYIGTISNSIYKTVDGGENWNHVDNDNLFVCMRDITLHPFAPETVFVGTTKGIYKSDDAGENWSFVVTPQYPRNQISAIQFHPTQPGLIFAGGPVNAWKSFDGGRTWEELAIPSLTGIIDLEVDPNNPDIIYFIGTSMYTERGVWKSVDRGVTWSNIQNNIVPIGSGTDIDIDPVNSDILYIAMDNLYCPGEACVLKSIDAGNSWHDISPDNLIAPYATTVAISPVDHNIIYAGTGDNGVLISYDSGNSWAELNTGLKTRHIATIEVDTMTHNLYLGTFYDGIYKSQPNGGIWQKISSNINSATCIDIDVCHSDPDRAFIVAKNGLFRTEDAGESWSYINVGMPIYCGPVDVAIDKYISNRLYVASGSTLFLGVEPVPNGLYISNDNGASWDFFNNGLPDSTTFRDIAISYLDEANRRIFISSLYCIYYSDDMGESWTSCDANLPDDIGKPFVKVAPSDPFTIAIGDYLPNRVFISHDRGDTWQQTGPIPQVEYARLKDLVFDPYNADHIIVSSFLQGIFESTNGGESWVNINNNLPVDESITIVSGISINPQNPLSIFVASNHYGIFQSHDGGQNWESFNAGLDTTDGVGYMMFAPGDTTKLYFAGSKSSGWSITRTISSIADDDALLPAQFAAYNYPNPFNAATNISFSLPQASDVRLDIYDMLGRKVSSLVNEYMFAGYHTVVWKPDGLGSGMYFYRITAGDYDACDKVMLLK